MVLAGNADWLSELPSVIKKNKKTKHHSTKMRASEAFKKRMQQKSIQISKTKDKNKNQIIY